MSARRWLFGLALFWLVHPGRAAAQSDADKLACVQAAGQGQTDRDEGRLLAARRELLECARDVCPAIVRKSCAHWLEALEPRIPSVVVRVVDPAGHDLSDVNVLLDGAPIALNGIPVPLDPGRHQLQVSSPGTSAAPPIARMILLAERETARLLSITLAAPQTSEPPPTLQPLAAKPVVDTDTAHSAPWHVPTGAWLLGGAGVLALGSFAYFAIAATSERADLKERCGKSCTPAETQSGRNQALVADVSLGVGIAALAAAAAWTVWARPAREPNLVLIPARDGARCQWTARF